MCLRQAQISIFGAFDRLRYQFSVPSTGSGTGSSNKYKTVIERSRNHREDENKNVPSTGSGTGSSNKYKTVAEPVEATQ